MTCAANHGILALSSGLGRGFEELVDQSLGGAWELDPQRGVQEMSGDITGWLRYDNQEWLLIALAQWIFYVGFGRCLATKGGPPALPGWQ